MFRGEPVDAVGYASTTSAYVIGYEAETAMVSRLAARLALPVAATCAAAVRGLQALDVERLALVGAPWLDHETMSSAPPTPAAKASTSSSHAARTNLEEGGAYLKACCSLYGELARRTGWCVVELNQAAALAEAGDLEAALALADRLELDQYHFLHATRAEFLRRLDRTDYRPRSVRPRARTRPFRHRAALPRAVAGPNSRADA